MLTPVQVGTVRIEAAALRGLETGQRELLGRPLTEQERRELRAGYVDDEVLLHEALRRGLQWSDFRARRRLVRIMRGALTDTVPDPSVVQLQAYFRENLDRLTTPESATFEQVMFPWGKEVGEEELLGVLAKLRSGVDPEEFGTTTLTAGRRVPRATRFDVVSRFGAAFADRVEKLQTSQWQGPMESLHGIHLVRVEERHPAEVPKFEDVESYLRQEWLMNRTRDLQQERVDEIRESYRIEFVDE
jgi:hypothetical protein